jgi:LPXTG-motif cell wall-anchored protein
MNNIKWLSKPIIIAILILLIFFISLSTANASEKEIDINTIPNGYLFKVENIKPGDWMPRDLVIKNEGKQDFKYTAIVRETKSYKGLFEELLLLVKKDTFVLFDGKLKDFKGLSPRILSKGAQETLFFQVTMPYELGNEFQASAAEAEIIFYAEGIRNTPPSCEEDPSQVGCEQPPSCEEDPTQAGCEQPPSCEEDPTQAGCEQPPSCEEDPSQVGCEQPPSCEEDPTQAGCEPPGGNPGNPGDDNGTPGTGETPVMSEPDITEVVVIPKDVNSLPNTATNNYNILLVGGLLFAFGNLLYFIQYRRRRREQ